MGVISVEMWLGLGGYALFGLFKLWLVLSTEAAERRMQGSR